LIDTKHELRHHQREDAAPSKLNHDRHHELTLTGWLKVDNQLNKPGSQNTSTHPPFSATRSLENILCGLSSLNTHLRSFSEQVLEKKGGGLVKAARS
jgi:hypothetical protein